MAFMFDIVSHSLEEEMAFAPALVFSVWSASELYAQFASF